MAEQRNLPACLPRRLPVCPPACSIRTAECPLDWPAGLLALVESNEHTLRTAYVHFSAAA